MSEPEIKKTIREGDRVRNIVTQDLKKGGVLLAKGVMGTYLGTSPGVRTSDPLQKSAQSNILGNAGVILWDSPIFEAENAFACFEKVLNNTDIEMYNKRLTWTLWEYLKITKEKDPGRTCLLCGGPATVLFNLVECANPSCDNYKAS